MPANFSREPARHPAHSVRDLIVYENSYRVPDENRAITLYRVFIIIITSCQVIFQSKGHVSINYHKLSSLHWMLVAHSRMRTFYLQLWWYTKMCTNQVKINENIVYFRSQKAGPRTPCVWKMLIIPPPLATALHRSSHMLLYKLFTYNGGLYWAATRLFRIQIKRLDFRPPRAKEGICVDTKGLSLPHLLLCLAEQGSERSFWPEPLSLRAVIHRFRRFMQKIHELLQTLKEIKKKT